MSLHEHCPILFIEFLLGPIQNFLSQPGLEPLIHLGNPHIKLPIPFSTEHIFSKIKFNNFMIIFNSGINIKFIVPTSLAIIFRIIHNIINNTFVSLSNLL